MKRFGNVILKKWYWFLFAAVVLGEAAVFLFFGEGSYIATHDNLDLFMGHFQAMKLWDVFFAHNAEVPILGGITRDYLSSEFNLYNILFYLLPPFAAYMCGYFLKILIAEGSVLLLAKDIYRENYKKYEPAAVIIGLIYGLLPLFPAYGIAFASIPLAVLLLRRIYRGESRWDYLFLFLYPLLSYFSYFGFFILGYLVLAIVILAVRDYGRMKKAAPDEKMGRRMCGKMSRRTHGRKHRRMHRGKRGGPPSCAPLACGLRRPWSSFRQAIFCLNTGCSGRCFFPT